MTPLESHILDTIKKRRKEEGFTQETFSKALNVKRSLVGAWEEGRSFPKIDVLFHICMYFEIDLNEVCLEFLSDNGSLNK